MTRREWFMQLGGGVVLAGWSTAYLDAAELPPGVYEASRDHLSHALSGQGLAAGTQTELVQVRNVQFRPSFFTPAEYRTIVQLTALILGESPAVPVVNEIAEWIDLTVGESAALRSAALAFTTPQRTLAIHYYGSKSVEHLEQFDPQTVCREGLNWIVQQPKSSLVEVVQSISDDRPAPHIENAGTRFFTYLKGQVADGFYTSRLGLEELGRGNPNFHATPPGCAR